MKVVDVRLRLLMPQSTYTPRDLDELLDVIRLHAYESAEVTGVIVSPVGLSDALSAKQGETNGG